MARHKSRVVSVAAAQGTNAPRGTGGLRLHRQVKRVLAARFFFCFLVNITYPSLAIITLPSSPPATSHTPPLLLPLASPIAIAASAFSTIGWCL